MLLYSRRELYMWRSENTQRDAENRRGTQKELLERDIDWAKAASVARNV